MKTIYEEIAEAILLEIGKTEPDTISDDEFEGSLNFVVINQQQIAKTLNAPWPVKTADALYTLIHEIRHWQQLEPNTMSFWLSCPKWVVEFDAEKYTHQTFNKFGFVVSEKHKQRAKYALAKYFFEEPYSSLIEILKINKTIPLKSVAHFSYEELFEWCNC